jgi:hypothetical protein
MSKQGDVIENPVTGEYLTRQRPTVPVEPWPGPLQPADVTFPLHAEQPV